MSHRIGFISTRFAGTDGVSLETAKWAEVLERLGHSCFYFSGQSDRPSEISQVVPEAFYRHPVIDAINTVAYAGTWGTPEQTRASRPDLVGLHKDFFSIYIRPPHISRQVQELKEYLKKELYSFVRAFEVELLIVENASTIPLNIPLGLAIAEFVAETGFPMIAHHHDFHWERQRFAVNCVSDYIASAFPPVQHPIRHVVINTVQAQQLASRYGVFSRVIPNVMDFDVPPPAPDAYCSTVRADLGVHDGEYLVLQPTRIIQRKGIEHAIELVRRLGFKARLVISHAAGDEGTAYERRVHEFADLLGVSISFEADQVGDTRSTLPDGRKIYTLGDVYPQADLVTYPSSIEGFGNAFLEAVYYRRPLVVNNYSIYEIDIKPKGFRVVEFDGFISDATLTDVRRILLDRDLAAAWAEENYALAKRYFSYSMLEIRLRTLLADCFGYAPDRAGYPR